MMRRLVLGCGLALLALPVAAAAAASGVAGLPMFEGATAYGGDACLDCHDEDKADFFAHTAHGTAAIPGTELASCEAGHGPGSLHVDEGGEGPILGPSMIAELGADAANVMCTQCHGVQGDTWHAGPHAGADLNCFVCHGDVVHAADAVTPARDFRVAGEFCLQCHQEQTADFRLPYRHRVLENEVACMDCHSPHGELEATWGFEGRDSACLGCHVEMAGPFVFEHEGVSGEDCTACHRPHGSINDKLLVQDENGLCLQCHYEPGFLGGDAPDGFDVTAHAGLLGGQSRCYDCHVEVHGSNLDPNFRDR